MMIENLSSKSVRRRSLLRALDSCDSPYVREDMLLDMVLELEQSLFELQQNYIVLLESKTSMLCVPLPF